jgi:hypothetical protein
LGVESGDEFGGERSELHRISRKLGVDHLFDSNGRIPSSTAIHRPQHVTSVDKERT